MDLTSWLIQFLPGFAVGSAAVLGPDLPWLARLHNCHAATTHIHTEHNAAFQISTFSTNSHVTTLASIEGES